MLDTADYLLAWPRDLFIDEAQALLYQPTDTEWIDRAELLLEEAFVGLAPRDAVRSNTMPGWWEPGPRGVVQGLVHQSDDLRQAAEPMPYWSQRRGAPAPQGGSEWVMNEFVRLVGDLEQRGYLERAFPGGCVDARDFYPPDPSGQLESHLGVADLWPLEGSRPRWDQDVFFDLVEVLHDLVARPRSRSFHDYGGCGWHYGHFALEPGRRLYRWKVNQLLDRSTVAYRLAEEGEDVGRLVAVTDDARAELASTMAERNDLTGDRVRHGLALFRARGASEHDKRSAIVALAGILEERRQLLKDRLYRKDESALFEIANRFALRHQRTDQLADYDSAFLDWVFWWYLATIELTDRLIARAEDPQA